MRKRNLKRWRVKSFYNLGVFQRIQFVTTSCITKLEIAIPVIIRDLEAIRWRPRCGLVERYKDTAPEPDCDVLRSPDGSSSCAWDVLCPGRIPIPNRSALRAPDHAKDQSIRFLHTIMFLLDGISPTKGQLVR